ncbi:MAG: hypothetical protein JSS86_00660 [Cyanobacteria bacterium SZAS LIN-2]|nr:hypothetical protein [Cyanobacteria bacterium SZAS LIN-2]
MKEITERIDLAKLDHDELLHSLEHRYQTCWQSGPNEADFPASRNFAIRIRHRHGRIERIWAGPLLRRRADLEEMLTGVTDETLGAADSEIARGTLTTSPPLKGGLRCDRSGVQLLPADGGTPMPEMGLGDRPIVIEYPIQGSTVQGTRMWRRRKALQEYAWVLNALLNGTIRGPTVRARSVWMRLPGADGRFLYGNEQIPEATQEAFVPRLSAVSTPAPLLPAELHDGERETRQRALAERRHIDELALPDDLDDSLVRFQSLVGIERHRFLQACASLYLANEVWDRSVSGFLVFSVQSLETVAQELPRHRRHWYVLQRPIGPTKRFRMICEQYGSAAGIDSRTLAKVYEVRSNLVHGEALLDFDRRPWGLGSVGPVLGLAEFDAIESVAALAKAVLRGWLRGRPMGH